MKRKCAITGIIYFLLTVIFYFVAHDQIKYNYIESNLKDVRGILAEVYQGQKIEQEVIPGVELLDQISIPLTTLGRDVKGNMTLSLYDSKTGELLEQKTAVMDNLEDNTVYEWKLSSVISSRKNPQLLLRIQSDSMQGEGPVVYYTDKESGEPNTYLNSEKMGYSLRYNFIGKNISVLGQYFWWFAIGIGVFIETFLSYSLLMEKKGKYNFVVIFENVYKKYKFLIKQLVMRDFKTKYKRSVLGYLWSLLNPLLTMAIQYIVFSTIFRGNIENFPVYLLSGIILFNFFSEAVGQGLVSVVGNAPLITKVYMPKYIYPVTKVISCSINLWISVIPLLIVAFLTGAPFTKALIVLPYVLICLVLFTIGMSLILATAMVFFRDTQYLWGIISLIWMYATPLFYPENILPEKFQIIQKINPLYQMVKFIRTILIEGVSPEPRRYVYCILPAIVICLIGGWIFKKNQDKFVLYI